MTALERGILGRTGLQVTPVCMGCGVLGGMPQAFGYDVAADLAVATVREALRGPINFLDTSAGYSAGESERRVGRALREAGGLPAGYVLATKADPDPATGEFDGAAVRRSVGASRERLGLERLQLLYLHDPERIGFDEAMAPGGPVEAMRALQAERVVDHLGVAGGPVDLLGRFVSTGAFEVVLTHNRYTLMDPSAEDLLETAHRSGVAVVNAAPFGGGILAKGPGRQRRYAYREAGREILSVAEQMQASCQEYDVPLGAAALQFSVREPRIGSTVVGLSAPERIGQTLEWAAWPIPDELWKRLEAIKGEE